jgi:peptidoglycan/xylan/chitin deacetylase (PgdA/CDA1 family)
MHRYAIVGLCLVGGLAWAVSLSFAPSAKRVVSLPVISLAKTELPSTHWHPAPSEPKPAEQPVIQAAVQPDAKGAELPAPQIELRSGEDLTADIKAAADHPVAQPEMTASIAKPIVQAALEPAVKSDDIAPPPAAQPVQPDSHPAEAPAAVPAPQVAQGCPGNPDAIGTSRVLTISPTEFSLLGSLQYKQTLPLKDHEVVLTFDDGPIPPYTNSILDTLAANCVKATYFLVGEMAHARPNLVRRIYNEGHSIGTHSQNHPFAFQRLSMQSVERQVDGGINSVNAALGDPRALSPFFRIPGFGRTNAIDHFLEAKGLVTWSTDVDTDDWWRGSTPRAIVDRAMRRLNAKGRGIILMHDIHPATVMALPLLLKQLKASGYRVVQVVATGERPKSLPDLVATAAEKGNWPRVLHSDADKGGPVKTALRHRVKLALSHHRHRRGVESKEAGQIDYTATSSLDRRLSRSY